MYCKSVFTQPHKFHINIYNMRRLEPKESKYCYHRRVKHKNGWSKGKTNLHQR